MRLSTKQIGLLRWPFALSANTARHSSQNSRLQSQNQIMRAHSLAIDIPHHSIRNHSNWRENDPPPPQNDPQVMADRL